MKLGILTAAALAIGSSFMSMPVHAQDTPFKIAFLAASSQNGFNQAIYSGIQKAAKAYPNVTTEIFDGKFSAPTQFSQVEDLTASKRFDAIILSPNDTVGIATALEDATAAGIKVATTLFPVGPDLKNMQPQIKDLTTTVASDPSIGAKAQAEKIVEYCASKDPCRVVVMMGQLIYPFDNLRYDSFKEVLGQHKNIKIVATGEGNYSPDTSLKAMQDILQANPEIDAVLSNADQHLLGVEIALEDAGIDPSSIYLIGGGLNQITIDKIREGKFKASLANFPESMGSAALDAIVKSLKGEQVPVWIDESKLRDIPMIVDKPWLDAHPDFKAEWPG
ncbi:sugar ABC transporter substrate-binding protein [Agrobacterium rubi]|uniref:Sugar ABC transporter substrate-binding protein n=1 Tax=Agrobacterium rubi TaxID=28099 RepID=A0AAE7R4N1_9HYPH|nr:sugar ABC transporter substrate-binding protein [Agrobacterium rubi]NTE88062.1 sugar ABC transporter substrate-binding protein [Agrobacterium rubi]NTF03829.1 sugar ABC transporter substrate-binding protein [Agrobacterium rubi]NTF38156.1 sugar ABC transporter substrate-binding protein [Agrobacterium rubi]QTG01938.1 sugar ABC transporter substrate-binding protein [Agrobacterium rubi]